MSEPDECTRHQFIEEDTHDVCLLCGLVRERLNYNLTQFESKHTSILPDVKKNSRDARTKHFILTYFAEKNVPASYDKKTFFRWMNKVLQVKTMYRKSLIRYLLYIYEKNMGVIHHLPVKKINLFLLQEIVKILGIKLRNRDFELELSKAFSEKKISPQDIEKIVKYRKIKKCGIRRALIDLKLMDLVRS